MSLPKMRRPMVPGRAVCSPGRASVTRPGSVAPSMLNRTGPSRRSACRGGFGRRCARGPTPLRQLLVVRGPGDRAAAGDDTGRRGEALLGAERERLARHLGVAAMKKEGARAGVLEDVGHLLGLEPVADLHAGRAEVPER